MLVLTRKVGESILIGDKIEVIVVRVGHDGVRIGIDAPKEVNVIRKDLKERLEAQGIEVRPDK